MKPGSIDFVAALISAGLCIALLPVGGDIANLINNSGKYTLQQNYEIFNPYNSPFNPYQNQQLNRPRPQPRPQAQRPAPPPPLPAPPPQPYSMDDCKRDVRLGSDSPQQSYVDAYCTCFAPQRARLGPRDLSEQQEFNVGKTIDQNLMPQCERQALTPFANSTSLESDFLRGFKPLCAEKPFFFYGEKADLGKTDELCDCLAKAILDDKPSMAAFIAGAGRINTRPYVQEQRNACVKRVFPPPASAGWQISSKADGRKLAYVDAKNHKLISRIEMTCTDAGQPRLNVTWRHKPPKEQIYFGGGDTQEDVAIPLKNGQVEGAFAKKFYDQLVFWQEINKKDHFDLDTTDFPVQVSGDEVGDGYGIVLGDTKVRVSGLISDCKIMSKPLASGTDGKNAGVQRVPSDDKCQVKFENIKNDFFKKNNEKGPETSQWICRQANIVRAAAKKYINAMNNCPERDPTGTYRRNVKSSFDGYKKIVDLCGG